MTTIQWILLGIKIIQAIEDKDPGFLKKKLLPTAFDNMDGTAQEKSEVFDGLRIIIDKILGE